MTADKVLSIAESFLGVRENPKGNVIFNTHYYGHAVSGDKYDWCCSFVWDVFRLAGASELLYGGRKTAYCPTLWTYHKKRGQAVTDYRRGDIILFDFNGNKIPDHVGICEGYNGLMITTIDGNTGSNEAHGGAVQRKTRSKLLVCGAFRPAYEEDAMTQLEFDAMLEDYLSRQARKEKSDWSELPPSITDGTRPRSFATREECATMIANALHRLADALA